LAVELSRDQAREYRVVQTGTETPDGSLAEIVWDVVTELPELPDEFDDPDLGKFGKKFYHHLIEPGEGRAVVDKWSDITKEIERCRQNCFADLNLGFEARYLRRLYRKYMAVVVRWMSKLTGDLATQLIDEKRSDVSPLTPVEVAMRNLRYGSADQFGKINVGFLFGCGQLFSVFFNNIYQAIAGGQSEARRTKATNDLFKFVYLHRRYQELRKYARREEKMEQPGRTQSKVPGQRALTESLIDHKARSPVENAAVADEMMMLAEQILPDLENSKPMYAHFTRLFIEHDGDTEAAAAEANLTKRQFTRRLKETVFPAVRRTAKRLQREDATED
jgi:hypothetical protein